MTHVIENGDADEASDRELALQIGAILEKHYPNHPFVVGFQGRALVIRHLAISSEVDRVLKSGGFCSLLPPSGLGTPKEVTQTVIRHAGELLEAFGLPRGPWDGRLPVVPKEWFRGMQRFN
jgi:hypothetical protein